MKQARKAGAGVSRREREKRWGRNVDWLGMPVVEWTARAGVAKKGETPGKACQGLRTMNGLNAGTYSEGGASS
jgi:hypothetical protein